MIDSNKFSLPFNPILIPNIRSYFAGTLFNPFNIGYIDRDLRYLLIFSQEKILRFMEKGHVFFAQSK